MNESSVIELLINEKRCPECTDDSIYSTVNECQEWILWQCVNCGWEKQYNLSTFILKGH